MKNIEIRNALKKHALKQWELAELLGVSEQTICRWLRKELPMEKKMFILNLIERSDQNANNVTN